MKTLPLLTLIALSGLCIRAEARDHVSIGLSVGPGWGYYPRYYAEPYPVYTAPVYYAQPGMPPPVYQGLPAGVTQYAPVDIQVVRVQEALRQRKYYHGAVDGLAGPATQAAIRAYQVDRSLPLSGKIDPVLVSDLGL